MKKVLYILITVFFVYLWFRLTDLNLALKLISKANLLYICFSVVVGILMHLIVSLRLKMLFKIIKKEIPFFFLWSGGYVSGLLTIILPFFTGGFLLSYLISKKIKSSYTKSFSVVLTDFCLEILPVFLVGLIGAMRFGIYQPVFLLIFLGLVTVFSFIIFRNKLRSILNILIKNKKILLKAIFLTFIVFSLGNLQLYLFFLAFSVSPNFLDFILAYSLFGILNLIPGAPTKIGQYETIGLFLFFYLLNIDKSQVLAILLSQHILTLAIGIFFGLIFLPLFDISYYLKKRKRIIDKD